MFSLKTTNYINNVNNFATNMGSSNFFANTQGLSACNHNDSAEIALWVRSDKSYQVNPQSKESLFS
jgi:hypothetical protein